MKALLVDGAVVLVGNGQFSSPNGYRHPAAAWDIWNDAEWQKWFGPTATVVDVTRDPVPFGKTESGPPTYEVREGAVYEVPATTNLSLSALKVNLKAALAAKRYAVETGGINVGGTLVNTDDRTQAKIGNAKQRGQAVSNWKTSGGAFVSLTVPQINAIFSAVAAHVQDCFDREATLSAAIDAAATVQDLAAIDITTGWPA